MANTKSFYSHRRKDSQPEPGQPSYQTGIYRGLVGRDPQGGPVYQEEYLRGWDHFPGLSGLDARRYRWMLESYSAEDAPGALSGGSNEQLDGASFAFVRPTGTSIVSIWERGEHGAERLVPQDEALQLVNLGIDRWNAKGQKRISRYLRTSYAFGTLSTEQHPIYHFPGQDSDWDAYMLVSRPTFESMLAGKPEHLQQAYRRQGRFETTLQGALGQWKGHARVVDRIQDVFPDAPQGTAFAIQQGSWKKETHGEYAGPDELFYDVRAKQFHTGVDMDVQTWTNLGRYILPNQRYQDWTRQKNDEFIQKIFSGLSQQEMFGMVFSGVEEEEQLRS
ncbi:MAG: hypothetical protein ACKOC5_12570, partial [Chloroflexota bacterium]